MLQFRIGLFFGAASLAGAFSGLLAFGISFMDGVGGLEAWSWIFVRHCLTTMSLVLLSSYRLELTAVVSEFYAWDGDLDHVA